MWHLGSEVIRKLAVVDFLRSPPRGTTCLAGDFHLVNAILICLFIGPFGAFPGQFCVLLRRILACRRYILSCHVLFNGIDCDIAGHVRQELISLRILLAHLLLLLLLLALRVRRDVVSADFGFGGRSVLLGVPRVLILILIVVLLLLGLHLLLVLLLLSGLLGLPLGILLGLVFVPGLLLGPVAPRILMRLPLLLADRRLVLLVLTLTRPVSQTRARALHYAPTLAGTSA